jgi:hypothetical protein
MNWSSIVAKAPNAPLAKKTPKAPVKQNTPAPEPPGPAPAKEAPAPAPPPAKKTSPPHQNVPKASSWASKVGTSAPPVKPKMPAKKSPSPAPAKSNVTPTVTKTLAPIVPISVTPSDGWAHLPADILSHHLVPYLPHVSTIRVLRRLCRHYAKSVALPQVYTRIRYGNVKPFFPALAVCSAAHITLDGSDGFDKAIDYLKRNSALQELRVSKWGTLEIDLFRAFASLLESSSHLEVLHLTFYALTESEAALLAGALQRQKSPLKSVFIYFQGTTLRKNLPSFINCLASKRIQNFEFNLDGMTPEVAKSIADWLASPSCSLVDLKWQNFPDIELVSIVLDGLRVNRSLRSLDLPNVRSAGSSLVDAIAEQGHIERLRIQPYEKIPFGPLFNLLSKSKQLKCEKCDFWPQNSDMTAVGETAFFDYIKSPNCFTEFDDLKKWLWNFQNSPALPEALKQNTSVKFMNIHVAERADIDLRWCSLIAGSKSLSNLSLGQFLHAPEELIQALKLNKGLQRITMERNYAKEPHAAEMRKIISAIGHVRSLRELRLARCTLDHCASELSNLIKSRKNLRQIELEECKLSEATLIQILTAMASTGGIEHLDMGQVTIHSLAASRDALNKAMVKMLESNPIQLLCMSGWQMDASTINSMVSCIDSLPTLALHTWKLGDVNMSDIVRKNLNAMVDRKGGLLVVRI